MRTTANSQKRKISYSSQNQSNVKSTKNLLNIKLSPLKIGGIKIDDEFVEKPILKILKSTFKEEMKIRSSSSKVIPQIQKHELKRVTQHKQQPQSQVNIDFQIKNTLESLIEKDFRQYIIIEEKELLQIRIISTKWWKVIASLLTSTKQLCKLKHNAMYNFANVYSCLQKEQNQIEKEIIHIFQDKNHISLIIQIFAYQKKIFYYILAMKKWDQQNQLLIWITQAINSILYQKKILLQIYSQVIENNQKYNKLKKPSNISREKKLIRINKQLNLLDETSKQMHESLHKKFDIFKNQCTTLAELHHFENQLRIAILGLIIPPFCKNIAQKQYCFIFQPQDIFFQEDKKNSCIILRSFTQHFLSKMSQHANLIIFSSKEAHKLTDFLRSIEPLKVDEVLDRKAITYSEGKPIKDISKIHHQLNKIIVLDKNQKKYHHNWIKHCIPYQKLISDDDNFIESICDKLIKSMEEHKDFENGLISDLFQRKRVTRH